MPSNQDFATDANSSDGMAIPLRYVNTVPARFRVPPRIAKTLSKSRSPSVGNPGRGATYPATVAASYGTLGTRGRECSL